MVPWSCHRITLIMLQEVNLGLWAVFWRQGYSDCPILSIDGRASAWREAGLGQCRVLIIRSYISWISITQVVVPFITCLSRFDLWTMPFSIRQYKFSHQDDTELHCSMANIWVASGRPNYTIGVCPVCRYEMLREEGYIEQETQQRKQSQDHDSERLLMWICRLLWRSIFCKPSCCQLYCCRGAG